MCYFAFHSFWGLYSERISIFRISLLIQSSFAHHNRFINSGFQATQLHHRLTEVNTFPGKFPQFLPRPNIAYTSALLSSFLETSPCFFFSMVFSSMGWMQPAHFSFSPWAGCNQPVFLFSMGWMQPARFSFLHGLDATSPFLFSPWAGCNQPISLFSMGWMKPVHFFCASIFDSWHTTLHHDCSIIADLFETQDNLHVLFSAAYQQPELKRWLDEATPLQGIEN